MSFGKLATVTNAGVIGMTTTITTTIIITTTTSCKGFGADALHVARSELRIIPCNAVKIVHCNVYSYIYIYIYIYIYMLYVVYILVG